MQAKPKEQEKKAATEKPKEALKPAHTDKGWSAAITLTPQDAKNLVAAARTLQSLACAIDPKYEEREEGEEGDADEEDD